MTICYLFSTVSLMTVMSDDAGTQTIEWMNMSHFLTLHKVISNELACQLLQEEDKIGREFDVGHLHSKHSKNNQKQSQTPFYNMNYTPWKDVNQKSYRQACPNLSGFHVSTFISNVFAHSTDTIF